MRGWMRTGILCGALGLSGALLPCNAAAQTLGLFTQGSDVGTPSTIGRIYRRYDPERRATPSPEAARTCGRPRITSIRLEEGVGRRHARGHGRIRRFRPATGAPDPHRKACSGHPAVARLRRDLRGRGRARRRPDVASVARLERRRDARSPVRGVGPTRLRIEKRGNYISMSMASAARSCMPAGGAARVDLTGEFYIGLGVSAHNAGRIETASFSNVKLGSSRAA